MIKSIHTINRNMNILQKKQENTSANIANVKTPGFKFQDIVQSTLESKEMINYSGGSKDNRRQELGAFEFGNQIDLVYRNFGQGSIVDTGNSKDFAIIGNGFFTIQMGNGLGFTRNGNFKLNEENQLVTIDGNPVIGVDANGQQNFIYSENDEIITTNFLISDFADYRNLNSIGNTIFTSVGGDNEAIVGEVSQGFLEMSNVVIADELVRMIEISREFEANQKLLHTADETLNKAVNEIGRV